MRPRPRPLPPPQSRWRPQDGACLYALSPLFLLSPAAAGGGRASSSSSSSSSGPATATATTPVRVPARPMASCSARRYPDRVPGRPLPPPPGQPQPPLRPLPPPPLPPVPIVRAGPSSRRPGHFRLRGPAPPGAGRGKALVAPGPQSVVRGGTGRGQGSTERGGEGGPTRRWWPMRGQGLYGIGRRAPGGGRGAGDDVRTDRGERGNWV